MSKNINIASIMRFLSRKIFFCKKKTLRLLFPAIQKSAGNKLTNVMWFNYKIRMRAYRHPRLFTAANI